MSESAATPPKTGAETTEPATAEPAPETADVGTTAEAATAEPAAETADVGTATEAAAAEPAAPETAGPAATFLVVHDKEGVVGAFESAAKAAEVLAPYAGISFVASRWRGSGETVWTLPYRDIDVVAFASTDREAVVAAQRRLLPVDHVYPDDVDYWQVRMNELVGPAEKRLGAFAESIAAAAAGAAELREGKTLEDEATAKFLDFAGGLSSTLDESRINIFEGLVTEGVAPASGGGGEKPPPDPSGDK